jgi:putative restriction endonuclease
MTAPTAPPNAFPSSGNWTREQLKLAFYYYCQTPFGKLHGRNPDIVALAALIGRTPSALAMKLVNFASLDPSIINTGRKGLQGASSLDREIWDEFHADWERLAVECENLRQYLEQRGGPARGAPVEIDEIDDGIAMEDFIGETRRAVVEQRIKQAFFRRAVLSSYRGRCCISGVSETRLIVASHIVPWSANKANRLNPSNGLCLSAIHDKAFDKGLMTLSGDLRVILSDALRKRDEEFITRIFLPIENKVIEAPDRFAPNGEFLAYHRNNVFIERETA